MNIKYRKKKSFFSSMIMLLPSSLIRRIMIFCVTRWLTCVIYLASE